MSPKTNTKPIRTFRAATVEASIWRDDIKKDGRTVARHSVRLQKQFRKEDGGYENTDYFFPDELPRLILVAQRAYEFIALSESKGRDEPTPI